MSQYLLSIYQPDGDAPAPEVLDPIMRDVDAVAREAKAAGVWVFSAGLFPSATATVLRPEGTDVLVTDGPFTEGKEHLGGITVIDVPDLDAALEWSRRFAVALTLPVEVRPVSGSG